MNKILIIDDDKSICQTLQLHLGAEGHEVVMTQRIAEGREKWPEFSPDIVLLDLKLPDGTGLDLLREAKKAQWPGAVIMITGYQDMSSTIEAMKLGAHDYLLKPLNLEALDLSIKKARNFAALSERIKAISREGAGDFKPDDIIGATPGMHEVVKQIGLAAASPVTVLIRGASGTGKELVARVIHRSTTPDEPFVAINCSSVVGTLLESELFGHEKGAFTGADRRKIGKLEFAGSGTVFLDEISEMSLDLQAKILRVLQEREFERVGGLSTIAFKARLIAATNRELAAMVEQGSFRQDLYFRLKVFYIDLPPLRERHDDIPQLVAHLLKRINRELHLRITKVAEADLKRLAAYEWPGNVRELHNVLTRAAVLTKGDVLDLSDFRPESAAPHAAPETEWPPLKEIERRYIIRVLAYTGNNYGETCEILGITRPTLRKKMEDYGLREVRS